MMIKKIGIVANIAKEKSPVYTAALREWILKRGLEVYLEEGIAAKIGCSAHTLNEWVKKAEVDAGKRAGLPSDMAEKMKALERENRELRLEKEFLGKAAAYFARESR